MSQSGYDSSKGSDAFILCSIVGLVGIYYFLQSHYYIIASIWMFMRIVEMGPFYWIPDWFPFYGKLEIKKAIHFLWDMKAVDIAPITVSRFDHHYLHWFSYVPGLLMIYWGVRRVLSTGGVGQRYNMQELLRTVEPLYPNLNEFLTENPEKKPIIYKRNQKDTHRWAMSISPRDFSIEVPPHGLEERAKKDSSLKMPIWDGKVGFDENLAELSFKSQLGAHYNGIDNLKAHERKIFDTLTNKLSVHQEMKLEWITSVASHVLKVKSKSLNLKNMGVGMLKLHDHIDKLVAKLASSKTEVFSKKDFLQEGNLANIVSNMESKNIQDIFKLIYAESIMARHSFVRCGLMQLLDSARDSGVFAAHNFLWVKKIDRCLWYCISSVGRKVSFVESAGCFAHWVIEKQVQKPISHPEVTEAVEGLKKALWLDKTED
jgi:hypothetical protein